MSKQEIIAGVLGNFCEENNLGTAAATMLENLFGITCVPSIEGIPLGDYFSQRNFNFQYIEQAKQCIRSIYEIGATVNIEHQGKSYLDFTQGQYPYFNIYACEIQKKVKFTRRDLAAITRAFNAISSTASYGGAINDEVNAPVIVVFRQGNLLSIASCEHHARIDNTGDKIGKVTVIRDINCEKLHPGHRQILERIADDVQGCTTFDELFQKWIKSFSIDILSDKFFKEYTALYADIIALITNKRVVKEGNSWKEKPDELISQDEKEMYGKPIMESFKKFPDPEKAVRDYVKKLMGRLVFIQFLQKKGWMGCPLGDDWEGGDEDFLQNLFKASQHQDDFVDQVLEPLFADINTDRSPSGYLANSKLGIGDKKIPYLNGGLFEPDEYDKCTFKIPSKYFWNEDDSDEKHPGILKFFSNYYFTIDENAPDDVDVAVDPEMLSRIFENLLEDNKDKGAFYTPKEIVEYMCREALIAYLQMGISDDKTKKSFRQFVTSHDVNELKSSDVALVEKKLKDVKICDPAIGSGAFPMGMLRELFFCRRAIEEKSDKRDLLTIKKEIIQNSIYGVDIEKGAVDIARLRFWLLLIVDEETPQTLPNMEFKIMQGNSLLEQFRGVPLDDVYDSHQQTELAFDEETAARALLKENMFKYFNESNHVEKQKILKKIDMAVKSLVKAKTFGNSEIHQAIDALDLRNNQEFFLWHTWFNDVLADKKDTNGKFIKGSGGFDIVIGNPPYGELRDLSREQQEVNRNSKYHQYAIGGRINLFQYFYPLGIDIVKKSGIVSFIVQNSLMAEDTTINNRKFILDNCRILSLDSFPERYDVNKRVFKSVTMSVCICMIEKKDINDFDFLIRVWSDKYMSSSKQLSIKKSQIVHLYPESRIFPSCNQTEFQLLISIKKKGNYNIKAQAGEVDLTKYKPYFTQNGQVVRVITGSNIAPYFVATSALFGKDIALPLSVTNQLARREVRKWKRIVMQRITGVNAKRRFQGAILQEQQLCGNSTNYISENNNNVDLRYLLGLLNSTLLSYFDRLTNTNANITAKVLENLPIYIGASKYTNGIVLLVDQIHLAKNNNPYADTSILEHEIDRLVYELYGLTNAEVKIIDPNETTIGLDTDLFKA